MNLDQPQRKKVEEWIAQGLKLSEIQNFLQKDLGLKMTYMEVRLLVDDLKLTPKDVEPARPLTQNLNQASTPSESGPKPEAPAPAAEAETPGRVSVAVDQLTRPGALVSGKVTFSDGSKAAWYMDQTGRLGLQPEKTGYRPPPADVQQFQVALDAELTKLGL